MNRQHIVKLLGFHLLRVLCSNRLLGLLIKKSGLADRIGSGVILPASGRLQMNFPGVPEFYMRSDGKDSIASRVYFNGFESFEKETITLFVSLLESARTVLDIGANTGLYSMIACAQNRNRDVYAFEPLLFVYTYLRQNKQENAFENLHALAMGLDDEHHAGDSTLFIPMGITLPTGASLKQYAWPKIHEEKIATRTLDAVVDGLGITDIDLIKIDAETLEPRILSGGHETITAHRPIVLCEILHQIEADLIEAQFSEYDYEFFQITRTGLYPVDELKHDEKGVDINFLFLPSEKQILISKI